MIIINSQEDLKNYIKEIEYLKFTLNGLLYWDKITNMPSQGIEYRSEIMSYFAGKIHELSTNKSLISYINTLEEQNGLDDLTLAMIRKIKRNYKYTSKIPEKEYKEYICLIAKTEEIWEVAREENNFSKVKPYLNKIIDFYKRFAKYWGYEKNPYDALIGYYEEGITVEILDEVFEQLKDYTINILNKIKKSKVLIDDKLFLGNFAEHKQERMSKELLELIGFDFESGRLDTSAHPMTLALSNKDVRITTHYNKDDLKAAITSALHEGGHGLYEQDINNDLYGTFLAEASSMGIHEGQARLYENIIGKSYEFWKGYYSNFTEIFNEFKDVSLKDFIKSLNVVKPSLIRIDADELTYNIHIVIRYEIEKMLINEQIDVNDVPLTWKSKYKDYLGIEPKDDKTGVLQDVHWFSGYFGYFPTYALGNLYAAQFYNKLIKSNSNVLKEMEKGDLTNIHYWLKNNIHQYGAIYNPYELIEKVTGEKLTAKYFVEYLEKKFTNIYNI